MKVPPYFSEDPALWFDAPEVNFEISAITVTRTKYLHTRSALPYEVVRCLPKDLPHEYEDLKKAVIELSRLSAYKSFE